MQFDFHLFLHTFIVLSSSDFDCFKNDRKVFNQWILSLEFIIHELARETVVLPSIHSFILVGFAIDYCREKKKMKKYFRKFLIPLCYSTIFTFYSWFSFPFTTLFCCIQCYTKITILQLVFWMLESRLIWCV